MSSCSPAQNSQTVNLSANNNLNLNGTNVGDSGANWNITNTGVATFTSVSTVAEDGTVTALTVNEGYTYRNGVVKLSTALGLKIVYTSTYGAAGDNSATKIAAVPSPIKTAIKRLTLGLYDRRDDELLETNLDELGFGSMALLSPYIYIPRT